MVSEEMIEKINENINKCVAFLKENAIENQSIFVNYGREYSCGKLSNVLLVEKERVEVGNNWGYRASFTSLDRLDIYDKITFLENWKAIKESFFKESERVTSRIGIVGQVAFRFEI